jgi:hypothetical protein
VDRHLGHLQLLADRRIGESGLSPVGHAIYNDDVAFATERELSRKARDRQYKAGDDQADHDLRRFTTSNHDLLDIDRPIVILLSDQEIGSRSPTKDHIVATGGTLMSVHRHVEYFRLRRLAQDIPVREPFSAPEFLQPATEPRRLEQLAWPRNLFGELASIAELLAESEYASEHSDAENPSGHHR